MKKILSLVIIIVLMFSVCSCKSNPTTDEVGQIILQDKTPATEDTIDIENKEQTPEPEPQPEPQPEPEIEQTDVNNEQTKKFTLDNIFSPYEVVITLTVEESKKGLTYTPEDFPEIDCYYIYPYNYYPEEYRPEYKDNYTIALMLNDPSKENVLKYIEIAEKDTRVYSACPNALEPYANKLLVCIDEREEKYTVEDFKEYDVRNVSDTYISNRENNSHCYDIESTRRIQVSYDTQDRKQFITKLASDPRIHYIMPYFPWFDEKTLSIGITDEAQNDKEEYTAADFGLEDIATLKKPEASLSGAYNIVLNKPSKQTIVDLQKTLKQDPRIKYVQIDERGVIVYGIS